MSTIGATRTERDETDLFIHWLGTMTLDEIRVAGTRCRAHASVADEVAWWQATLRVQHLLRGQHARRTATASASQAARSVRFAARNAALPSDDKDVVAVARAAGDAVCALTAGLRATDDIAYFFARLGCLPTGPEHDALGPSPSRPRTKDDDKLFG